jgi:hypothetical protein
MVGRGAVAVANLTRGTVTPYNIEAQSPAMLHPVCACLSNSTLTFNMIIAFQLSANIDYITNARAYRTSTQAVMVWTRS